MYVNLSTKYQESIKVWLETGSLAKRTNDNLTVYLSSLHTTIGRYTPDFDWKWQPPPPRDWLLIITFRNVKTEYLHEWRINERSIKSIVFPVVSPLELLLNLVLKGEKRRVCSLAVLCVQGSGRVSAKHRQPPLSTGTFHSLESSQDLITEVQWFSQTFPASLGLPGC